MALYSRFVALYLFFLSSVVCQVTEFISIDCGSTTNYTDPRTGLAWISDNGIMNYGKSIELENPDGNWMQYRTRREFPIDTKKYCYSLGTQERRRYLVRATFQYGSLENEAAYPKFDLYLDATKWSTVTVLDATRVYVKEMIIRAPSNSVDVCICCATTGAPFLSTLELRPLNLSMYATDFEDNFFLEVAARVNFGAPTKDAIRYPDDPYDRIWASDLEKRQNFLVDVAPGTIRINTSKDIDINTREYPPVKVMQTAVVGTYGELSYRLNLEDFPANARAYAYFAEIEDLGANETRKFKLAQPYFPDYSNAVVNIEENANGSYRLYEPSYMNVSLQFVLSFAFAKTRDSSRGPILNAIEISKYLQIASKTDSQDLAVLNALRSMAAESAGNDEAGDPCVPTHWEWVNCTLTSPPRITKMYLPFLTCALSGKNMNGKIPQEINNLEGLTELWLDGNFLTGPFPDISNLVNLKILHLENNKLTGSLPKYFSSLPNLQELYEHNPGLHKPAGKKMRFKLILGTSIAILGVLLLVLLGSLLFLRRKTSSQKTDNLGNSMRTSNKPSSAYSVARGWHLTDEGISYYISLSELEEATKSFSKKIGKGSFGTVYYGQMKDGKEVAVKIMADSSTHLTQQFVTEVMSWSINQKRLDWLSRLRIAEDAAKDPRTSIYHFARALIRKGDVISIVDPVLIGNAKIESIWRIAEVAIQCVEQRAVSRPRMQEILLAIQEAIKIDKGTDGSQSLRSSSSKAQSSRKTLLTSFLEIESPDLSNGSLVPTAR
ncbi:hypothetical protein Tsubulata_024012 [Turnera subulata]|uniref:Malectin-like domain-containing protein n=1 Tax=Turnera subulata TaxID=218843 RepID=A0A9Q0FSD8_9ROSI|nr:hypothetical protein Tsubulata_024012 [Turnera subulata]